MFSFVLREEYAVENYDARGIVPSMVIFSAKTGALCRSDPEMCLLMMVDPVLCICIFGNNSHAEQRSARDGRRFRTKSRGDLIFSRLVLASELKMTKLLWSFSVCDK